MYTHSIAPSPNPAPENELGKLEQQTSTSSHAITVSHGENASVKEDPDGRLEDEQERARASAERLRNLVEAVEAVEEEVVRVVAGGARVGMWDGHEDGNEVAGLGWYVEGGWADVARLWGEGERCVPVSAQDGRDAQGWGVKPVRRVSEPRSGGGVEGGGTSGGACWFERSGAPSPEQGRVRRITRVGLRGGEGGVDVLQYRDPLEETGMRVEVLTRCCGAKGWESGLVCDVYGVQEEEEEEEEVDELYCTCGEGCGELGNTDEHVALRGGMGGRDEDEEFVYGYGGYTNWDEGDEPPRVGDATAEKENQAILDLRRQIERLEVQVSALTKASRREVLPRSIGPQLLHHGSTNHDEEGTAAKDTEKNFCGKQTKSSSDDGMGEERDVNLRGGIGEEDPEVEGSASREHTNARFLTSIPASPHLLCQRATSRIGDSTINYIIVSLPPGFIIPDSIQPELVFHSAATIYYFPTGATEDMVQRESWKQKGCGEGNWRDVVFHKMQSKQVFKSAIASMWETMGLDWDVLTRGDWSFDEEHDQGDMYMVSDNKLLLENPAGESAGPHIRGGSGDDPVQIPSPVDEDSVDEFKRLHESLIDEARMALMTGSPEQGVHAWMTVATTLKWRNSYLESRLEAFREMNNSLIQDLQWQIDMQVELEERLEAAETDKKAMAEDYRDLQNRLAILVEGAAYTASPSDEKRYVRSCGYCTEELDLGMTRGGDEALQPTTLTRNKAAEAIPSGPCHPYGTITANSFEFYPRRSTIVFAGAPPQVFQFPCRSTLPEIRSILEPGDGKEALSSDPYVERILQIMDIREEMGVHLPENLSDERITIGIPNIKTGSHSDREMKIAAWQVSDADVDGLEKLINGIEIHPDRAKSFSVASTKTASSEGEKEYYQDVGDLVNSLDGTVDREEESDPLRFCVCQTCPVDGGDTFSNPLDPQSPRVVSVRGGGSDPEYWNHDSHGNREFPLHYPKLPALVNAHPNAPTCYGTIAPASRRIPEDEEIATAKGPLSMRLGRLMFIPEFLQQRENSIRRFDWQHIKRLNPQFKDKSSRGFRYIRGARCEDWATKLDKHREHCDYCKAVFIEEDYATRDISPGHEDDAPEPNSGAGKPWAKSTWPEKSKAPPFSAVKCPDPRLRGGAGSETDLKYDSEDGEDWQSEWADVASQTQSAGYQHRTFRNSSTLSTKTMISPPSPVARGFNPRRWPRKLDLCTAEEFLRTGPAISDESWQVNAPQVRAGESVQPLHYYRPASPNHMTRSKTSHPLLLETRRSRDDASFERPHTRYKSFQYNSPSRVSTMESESVLDLRAENWLEKPRPAPSPPLNCHSTLSGQYSQQSHDVSLTKVYGYECSTPFIPLPREPSFRSDRNEFFPASRYGDLSENTLRMRSRTAPRSVPFSEMLSDEAYEEHVGLRSVNETRHSSPKSRPRPRLCKRCAKLLSMLIKYIRKLKQRLIARIAEQSGPRSVTETPAAPAPSRIGWEAWYKNRRLPSLPYDKSLPSTPQTSTLTLCLSRKHKEKFSVAPWVSDSLLECAHAIAQAQDRAHADFVSQGGDEWHVPTIAGPSDLVKEALMWLGYEAKSAKVGKSVFDGRMAEDAEA